MITYRSGVTSRDVYHSHDLIEIEILMKLRFYIDRETGLPHIYQHDISEYDVEEILRNPGEDRPGHEGSRVAIGQTLGGRYLRVIYVPDPEPNSVFVITAYQLTGKPLSAYRRRRRKRKKR